MDLIESIKTKARKNQKTIVLPEALDERILKASVRIAKERFAKEVILLGEKEIIFKNAKKCGVSLDGIKVIDPVFTKGEESEKKDEFTEIYYELRKDKGITKEEAAKIIRNPLYYGAMMVKLGKVDVMVAGAANTTANVIRAALQIINRRSKTDVISSCFIMIVPDCEYGENGILAFADAGVIPSPNSRQLADIAITTAKTFKLLTSCDPKVAMLSFSTKGSAQHRMVDKVIEATGMVKEKNPEILIDGELQPDAALVPFIAKRKAPNSPVAGMANVLIFPDLSSANIAYKLVERLAKAKAYGPLIQGLSKPISDLSRGCSVEDIVDISAITLVRA